MTLTTIIATLAGLVLGAAIGWLAARQGLSGLRQKATAGDEAAAKLDALRTSQQSLDATNGSLRKEVELQQATIAAAKEQYNSLYTQFEKLQAERNDLYATAETLRRETQLLKDQMQQDDKRRTEAFDKQLHMAQEELKNQTRQLLEQRADALGKSNSEQMSTVVQPLKEQLEAMRQQVNESMKTSTESRTSIEKAIEGLMKQTVIMQNEANSLVRALKNENKTQGNWGEMMLETLLESSGLEKGLHYETQVTLRDTLGRALVGDESGKRMIPDAIVHYPDGKDVVIDSKVSISAYIAYSNATDEAERSEALQQHIASLRKHVRDLSQKNYTAYIRPPRQALQYMVMFVPNEASLQTAMQADPTLWHDAFEAGVCITSEQNLIVLLRMIQMAWTQVQQYENQKEIMAQAKLLLDRVALFIERFAKIDAGIDDLRRRYNEANTTLAGRQGVLGAAKEMERLGAKTSSTRHLPELTDI